MDDSTSALVRENAELRRHAEQLAAALQAIIVDAHPTYRSTAKWRGGIGGSAITSHCSLTGGAPPGEEHWETNLFEEPLRAFLRDYPDFDVRAAAGALMTTWKATVAEQSRRGS